MDRYQIDCYLVLSMGIITAGALCSYVLCDPVLLDFDTQPFCLLPKTQEQQSGGVTDEVEPFMGSGRFGNFCFFTFAVICL